MNFLKFLGKRVVTIIFSIVVIIALTYGLTYIAPGNFFDIQRFQLGSTQQSNLTQEQIEQLRRGFEAKYGLDQPLWRQILNYLWSAAQFKFGPSYNNPSTNIETLLAKQFPVTLELGLMAIALAIVIGIPLGIVAALKRNTWADYLANFIAMLGQVIPAYVLAVFMVILFSVNLHWLPTSGWGEFKYIIMPVFALSLGPMASIARFTRVSLLDTLNQDYIRTAYAKGGKDNDVIVGHALRNSLIPITTIVGPNLAAILGGSAVFIESQFRIPGVGLLLVNAAGQRDYPLAITATFVLALSTMILNLIVDIVYAILDPRITLE
jgi:ABC-type dipeptide/oligopeptide/nickel transport systems, permease components